MPRNTDTFLFGIEWKVQKYNITSYLLFIPLFSTQFVIILR